MKLKKGFITHTIGDVQVMVAAGQAHETFSGVVKSNETAALIIECLKEETDKKHIVDTLCMNYEVSKDQASADVDRVLSKLDGIGALEY